MVQYQDTIILNRSIIAANQEQMVKHAFLTYKN